METRAFALFGIAAIGWVVGVAGIARSIAWRGANPFNPLEWSLDPLLGNAADLASRRERRLVMTGFGLPAAVIVALANFVVVATRPASSHWRHGRPVVVSAGTTKGFQNPTQRPGPARPYPGPSRLRPRRRARLRGRCRDRADQEEPPHLVGRARRPGTGGKGHGRSAQIGQFDRLPQGRRIPPAPAPCAQRHARKEGIAAESQARGGDTGQAVMRERGIAAAPS